MKNINFCIIKKKYIFLIIVLIIALVVSNYMYNAISPVFLNLIENKAQSIAISVTNQAIKEKLKDIDYSDLIYIEKDNEGKISLVKANTYTMNQVSNEISIYIEEQLDCLDNTYVSIPIGAILGNKLLMNIGPKIKIKIMPIGNMVTQFKSDFITSGINQTVHKLYIQVKSNVTIITPFINKSSSYESTILVNEVVLIGDVPNSFYNLSGISETLPDASLNMVD